MENFTIQNFWSQRLRVEDASGAHLVRGWTLIREGHASFMEAPVTLNNDLSCDRDPETSPLILISAPGAVGKSTLARQLAFSSGAIYVDLANTEPVGGNTLSGGLARSGLFGLWEDQKAAVLVDGLDEARLRVTQEAYEAFLGDIAEITRGRKLPTVLFGRTGAVQDSWLVLPNDTAVLEIGYFDPEMAIEFAEMRLRSLKPNSPHKTTEHQVISMLLTKLRDQAETDGDRFAGYAPVLQAVADRVAAEKNVGALIAQIEGGAQPITLPTVATTILDRERGKLEKLHFDDPKLVEQLYFPNEQLDRLVARVYGLPQPPIPLMTPHDAQIYSTALETWVGEHPFLDGRDRPSSAVFDAMIALRALRNPVSERFALQRELLRGAAANPFLSEFYLPEDSKSAHLPPEHIGIVYASLRARLSLGDTASLLMEGREDTDSEDMLNAEVEISISRGDVGRHRILAFESDQTGVLKLGPVIEDVDISLPYMTVELGPGTEASLIAPINIQCNRLQIMSERLVVEGSQGRSNAAVYLEATELSGANASIQLIVHGHVDLAVCWPDAHNYPWTRYATEPTPVTDPRLAEALRRFRKFVIAFRSHSKGSLGRFQDKLEHSRMTKGTGRAVLNLLTSEEILTLKGTMYYLDADRLGARAGATYSDCMARRFGNRTLDFVAKAL